MARAILLIIIFSLYAVSANVFSPFPRGSDQYWNIGNVDRVVNVDGLYKTNNIYPASLPASNAGLPRPWVQNRPIVYIVTAFALLTKHAQQTWIVINCVFLFLSALLLYKMLHTEKGSDDNLIKLFVACLFLVYPFNFYQALQGLGEIFNQFLVISIVYLLTRKPDTYAGVAGAGLLAGLLIYQRENYVLLILLLPFYFLFFAPRSKKYSFILVFTGITASLFLMKPLLLPSHTISPLNFISVITKERYGQSTMSAYLYATLPAQPLSRSVEVVMGRAAYALKAQFAISKSIALFFYLINLLLIPYILLLFNVRKLPLQQKKELFLVSVFVLLHFVTVSLYQNQYRFAAILVPLLMLCAYRVIQNARAYHKAARVFLIALITLFIAVNVYIGMQNRRESFNEHRLVMQVSDVKKSVIKNNPVFVDFTAELPWTIGYAMSPNLCYFFPGDTDMADIVNASEKLHTNFFIIQKNTDFYKRVKNNIISEQVINGERGIVLARVAVESRAGSSEPGVGNK